MRRVLEGLYRLALALAALCLVLIAVLVLAQVLGRIADKLLLFAGLRAFGLAVPSLAEIGGFLFVAASCLAFAPTLRAGTHVRVKIIAGAVGEGIARGLDAAMLIGAAALACFAAWHSSLLVLDSWQSGSVSYGTIPIPLWLPQTAMAAGFVILAIAVIDELVLTMTTGKAAFREAEAARDILESE